MQNPVIKVLYDNCKDKEPFQEGWGFSCLIDYGPRKILFDTGADTKAFFANLELFKMPCEAITDVVFSHKHADHTAGMQEVAGKLKPGARLFLPKGFPSKRLPSHLQIHLVEELREIYPDVYSLPLKGGFRLYEQALLLKTTKGIAILTGCAHPGIVSIIERVKMKFPDPIHLVLGGFHLFRKSKAEIGAIVKTFEDLRIECAAPCHCSGQEAIAQFAHAYQERFYKIGAGAQLTIST